jgi:hypothetical protein
MLSGYVWFIDLRLRFLSNGRQSAALSLAASKTAGTAMLIVTRS